MTTPVTPAPANPVQGGKVNLTQLIVTIIVAIVVTIIVSKVIRQEVVLVDANGNVIGRGEIKTSLKTGAPAQQA